MLTLSPIMVAPVCRVGDPLTMTCTASAEFVEWSIMVANEQGTLEEVMAFSNSRDMSQQLTQRVVNSIMFTFMRSSAQGASPLISTLSIDSVSSGLNGTVVRCMEVGGSVTPGSVSTTIHIVDISNNLYFPALDVASEKYKSHNVTVTVEWAQQGGAVYTVRVLPPVPIMVTGSTSRQLTIPYNAVYNFSVEALTVAPCRVNATAFITLNYANCGYPELLSTGSNVSVPGVEGYDSLAIEGTNITLNCSPGMVLIGPNSSTCMGNGEWESDPSVVMCNDSRPQDQVTCGNLFSDSSTADNDTVIVMGYMDPAMEGTTVTFSCLPEYILIGSNTTICMGNGEWEPDPRMVECTLKGKMEELRTFNILAVALSSTIAVVVFLLVTLSIFIAAFVYFSQRFKRSSKETPSQPVPIYEDVLLSSLGHQEQDVEMKENVAYGPLKYMGAAQQ